MKSYLAAAVQMTSKPDLIKNLVEAEELIELAVRKGAELVSLPENFAFLGKESEKSSSSQGNCRSNRAVSQQNGAAVSSYHFGGRFSRSRRG